MRLLREYVRLLLEQERTLYHGTSIFNRDSIEKYGLQPGVGHFVKSSYGTDASVDADDCNGAYNDVCAEKWGDEGEDYERCVEDAEEDCRREAERYPPTVFMASKKTMDDTLGGIVSSIAHHLGKEFHDVTDEEIEKYGMLIIAKEMDIPQMPEYHEQSPYEEYPGQAEPGDYYTGEAVYPDIILTGKKMLSMLRRYGAWPRANWASKNPKSEREMLIKLAVQRYGPERREEIIQKIDTMSPKEKQDQLRKLQAWSREES